MVENKLTSEISEEEFIRRFVDETIRIAGETFSDGSSIREYAPFGAQFYWDNKGVVPYSEGPEVCAKYNIEYWIKREGSFV